MPAPTLYTNINLITSVAGFLGNKFADSGWKIYWQSRAIFSGTGTVGEITIVPEFPSEPTYIVAPPRSRTQNEVITPAFCVHISSQPEEISLAGIGQDLYEQRTEMHVEGFVNDLGQHMAFATILRNFFRENTIIPIYDWESNVATPDLVDDRNNYIENRQIEAVELPNVPNPVRYYISMIFDLVYYD
jgi:hypothetical protein